MRAPQLGIFAALALLIGSNSASAYYPPPVNPDACGPGGFYCAGRCGMVYGPNYWVRPPYLPFNGMVFGSGNGNVYPTVNGGQVQVRVQPGYFTPQGKYIPPRVISGSPQGHPGFPTHPFARSPRDFFMVGD